MHIVKNAKIVGIYRKISIFGLFALLAVLSMSGCSALIDPKAASATVVITAQQSALHPGAATALAASVNGVPASGGAWSVDGGSANGTVDNSGTYHAPATPPSSGTVTVTYSYNGSVGVTTLSIVNSVPVITVLDPVLMPSSTVTMTVTGTGFVPKSVVLINGKPITTTYIDAAHVSGVLVPNPSGVQVQISNPDPGAATSTAVSLEAITMSATQTSVRVGGTIAFNATDNGQPAAGGTWAVLGGMANGFMDATGTYHAPDSVPSPNVIQVAYTNESTTITGSLTLLNPVPSLSSFSPAMVPRASTPITLTGSGFIPGAQILVNSVAIPATFIDSSHLRATLPPPPTNGSVLQIAVSNPDPGGATSQTIQIAESSLDFTVSPAVMSVGPTSIQITGSGFPAAPVVYLNGRPMTVTASTASTISATGFLPPWSTGTATVNIAGDATSAPLGSASVAIAPTTTPYDVAARFSTQAAFGPRPDLIQHIQQLGLAGFITEQQSLPSVVYNQAPAPRTQFLVAAQTGNSLLRLRVALAFQSFIVSQGIFCQSTTIPYEELLEKDAFGNFRDLMTDISQDENIAKLLNLAANNDYPWGYDPPNQNFARELMQLFTLGPNLLNEDGTLQTDSQGNPIPTYTQAEVVDLSRVFTGWNWPAEVNPDYFYYGIDWSVPLAARDDLHDKGSKTLIGNVYDPAGLDIFADRKLALDTIFQHPNLPPFISRILIQRLVKSSPSPAYTQRIARVFKDDGTGARGNLGAVIRAILLDPEARAGDTQLSADDGFIQEPLLQQLFTTSFTQQPLWDDEPAYFDDSIGEPWWFSPTVFGWYSPDYRIPGTTINSPEFQLLNNVTVTIRTEYLWGMLTGTIPGYGPVNFGNSSWLYNNFETVPELIDAIDHMAYHGQMPANEKAAILAYCQQLPEQDKDSQFRSALFLALNSDSFVVTH